ncbi:hypothetical protein QA600_11405 [Natronococcus sp. A-GB1]|uniref:hypothetical protein n=1 Tax=Natronococcus sp. A-GB1 TaxID=3037648 RepID=UPI00241DD2FD|nr:hypothetical protein [Natronococcus sp. A-GB1]MDG5759945.1 hypothetical protein [Natronococcus sp. A-GB1]
MAGRPVAVKWCYASMGIQDSATDDDSRTDPRRRAVLAAMGALTGTTVAGTGTATAQQDDGEVETRGCSDTELTPDDWSTGALTARACPGSSGEVQLSVTGNVSHDRQVPGTVSTETLYVPAGQRDTLWFTGRITGLSCSSSALNIGIAHRG